MKYFWWTCLLLFAAASASALEVQQVKWGFDGQVVPGRFNLLSVLVANPSATPFDGAVTLYKHRGLEERVGALYAAPCYVSPLMARWVQFYVYLDTPYDEWRLEWGRGPDDRHDLDAPKWGAPAQVLLSESETLESAPGPFKEFPDDLFPPTVAATGGLDCVLLDHAPRWEPAKRQAFLDWVRSGGKVHLLTGADGRYPIFSDELDALNSPLERTPLGAGLVVRHDTTARAIRKEDIGKGGPPQVKPDEQATPFQMADSFFRALAALSRPHYNWGLIYLLTLAYLAVIGPGIFLAGRRTPDYRLRIVLLVGTVAAFGWLFNLVGRRGQSEASVVHTLSYARAINGTAYNVTQWINVFATHGNQYTITHAAPHNLYATGQDYEAVNGQILSGKDGQFLVDIPMFSRRAFLHEAEMKGPEIPIKIAQWDDRSSAKNLTLTVGPDFAKQIREVWFVQGNRFFEMRVTGDRIELADSNGQTLETLLSANDLQQLGGMPYRYRYSDNDDDTVDVDGEFRKLAKPLMAWSLGSTKELEQYFASSRAADGRIQLFIFARSPESFSILGQHFGREVGYVLYHIDLFKPGGMP